MSITYPPETVNGVVTSWIPLTTGWTDIPDCHNRYVVYSYKRPAMPELVSDKSIFTSFRTETYSAFVAYDPFWGMYVDKYQQCLPSEVQIWRSQISFFDGGWLELSDSTKMSLLPLTCPDAWSTVATFIKLDISTQVMCCPP